MKTARDYQREIGEWANHNFTYIDQIGFGMVEEIGEYCHAILKSRQGIRGHVQAGTEGGIDTAVRLVEDLADSIADGLIFTLHWAEANQTFISFEETHQYCIQNEELCEWEVLAILMQCFSTMFRLQVAIIGQNDIDFRPVAQRLFNNFAMLAKCRAWKWETLLASTWKEVSKRDWIKFPINGKNQ